MCGQKIPSTSTSRALNTALHHVPAIKAANSETRREPSTTAALRPSPASIIKNEIGSQGTGYITEDQAEACLKSTFGAGKKISIRVRCSFLTNTVANTPNGHLEE
jgi:hypothetical protein